jgi:uncharacterized protein YbcI
MGTPPFEPFSLLSLDRADFHGERRETESPMDEKGRSAPRDGRGEQASRISREMVQLMRKVAGRGPTKARTTIGRDHVLVMFHETLTEGEQNLIDAGHDAQVEGLRSSYQALLRNDAEALIEETLGRKVIGFMSTNHFNPDMAAEVFVLDPFEEPRSQTPQEGEHEQS